jgi:hypothetical protein
VRAEEAGQREVKEEEGEGEGGEGAEGEGEGLSVVGGVEGVAEEVADEGVGRPGDYDMTSALVSFMQMCGKLTYEQLQGALCDPQAVQSAAHAVLPRPPPFSRRTDGAGDVDA